MSAPLSQTAKNFQSLFRQHGVTLKLTDEMYEQFAKFYRFLTEYNKKLNMTRINNFNDFAIKHYVDCLYVLQMIKLPTPLIDMGTGAGFPGIPFKIASPETRIILVEGVQKRVDYLKELRDHLGLKNLDIIGRNVDPKMQYPVQGLVTRAVETAASTLANAINCVQVGGKVILMKTPGIDAEIEEAKVKMGEIYELSENIDYTLKGTTHERKLLVYTKIRKNNPA